MPKSFHYAAVLILPILLTSRVNADVTYTLHFDPASSPEAQQVADSVATAADVYNQYGSFNKHWNVYHNPGIPTAEGNYDGYMGYGGTRTVRVAMHEAAHTFGMGTTGAYANLIAGGVWQGAFGNRAQFETYNNYADGLHGDGHAIWPGGFNYENEDGFIERIWHIRVMAGIRTDMGILSFTREATHEFAHPGETAEFSIEAPLATTYQWYKDEMPLTNGGDISGATGPILRIANAATEDAGSYRCAATGAGETLFSRPRLLWIHPEEMVAHWTLDGQARDSANGHDADTFGSPRYVSGMVGQAIDLDGTNDYVQIPDASVIAKDFTLATWVNWDGGGNWQRIFDIGTGIYQYVFLTPQSGSGGMRLAFKDSINGINTEYQLNAPVLPTGEWVHLAAVLQGDRATLYINGKPVASATGIPVNLTDFPPTQSYLGKSQYNDPYFNGRIDDFRMFNHALDGAEVWDLWGQSANQAPTFDAKTIQMPNASIGEPYSGQTLSGHAHDPDGDSLTFAKIHGPDWLSIAPDGTLSGTPTGATPGTNVFVVRVQDSSGASSDIEMEISVFGTVAYWTFEEGTPDTYLPYTPSSAGQYDGSILDQSGSGNHLSVWSDNWHRYRSQVPAATTPQTGLANTLSIENANNYPAISAIGTSLTNWSPTAWTLEAAIRPTDATNGFQTFIGRDSRGAHPANPALAALYFSITPEGGLRILFTDAVGSAWGITSDPNTLNDGQWYAVAATSDGKQLSLFLKNLTDADQDYTHLGTLDISSSAAPALSTGAGDGADWDAGVISLARGLYDGGHTDRFIGHIDDVRLTEGRLQPTEFLYSNPITPAAHWRTVHFGTPSNSGQAADDADPDGDGMTNLLERAFGGDPHFAENDLRPFVDTNEPLLSLVYRKALAATDLTFSVQETEALSSPWAPAAGSQSILSDDGEVQTIRFTRPAETEAQIFLRLEVISPE